MYTLLDYGWMLRAGARRDAYVEALRRTVRPGALVLEIGAGFGFFAVLAARLGAQHVYAVEPNELVHLGRQLARDNGVADRVTFVQGPVEELTLPRKADVIVSDLRGILPMMRGHFEAVKHARENLLTPDGVLIPTRDTLRVAAFDDVEAFAPWLDPWAAAPEGLDLSSLRPYVGNAWQKGRVREAALLGEPATWGAIDYRTLEPGPILGRVTLSILRAGTLHGLAAWFDAELVDGVGFSNAPDAAPLVYGHAIFPLERPLRVEAGVALDCELGATPVGEDWDFRWHVRARAAATGETVAEERHHSMLARPLAALVRTPGAAGRGPG